MCTTLSVLWLLIELTISISRSNELEKRYYGCTPHYDIFELELMKSDIMVWDYAFSVGHVPRPCPGHFLVVFCGNTHLANFASSPYFAKNCLYSFDSCKKFKGVRKWVCLGTMRRWKITWENIAICWLQTTNKCK